MRSSHVSCPASGTRLLFTFHQESLTGPVGREHFLRQKAGLFILPLFTSAEKDKQTLGHIRTHLTHSHRRQGSYSTCLPGEAGLSGLHLNTSKLAASSGPKVEPTQHP